MGLELAEVSRTFDRIIFIIGGSNRRENSRQAGRPARRKQRALTGPCKGTTPLYRRRCAVQRMKDRTTFIGHSQA